MVPGVGRGSGKFHFLRNGTNPKHNNYGMNECIDSLGILSLRFNNQPKQQFCKTFTSYIPDVPGCRTLENLDMILSIKELFLPCHAIERMVSVSKLGNFLLLHPVEVHSHFLCSIGLPFLCVFLYED
jgi:hypothetical protein